MPAVVMDGKALAARLKEELRLQVEGMAKKPGMAVVLVGDDPAAQVYIAGQRKDFRACGLYTEEFTLPGETSQEELLELLEALNSRPDLDGVQLQFPLPKHLDARAAALAIRPDKDVDCANPANLGALVLGEDCFKPCTPAAVMRLLAEYQIDPKGKKCVIVGRSNIVGKPLAMLMLAVDATVTVCHTKTPDLAAECRQADILISAAGRAGLITGEMVKPGAVVVDVAMNRGEDGKLCGDVVYAEAAEKASWITPVPGGVGPVTRAMLMENILTAAGRHGK